MAIISNKRFKDLLKDLGVIKTSELLGVSVSTIRRQKKKIEEGGNCTLLIDENDFKLGMRDGLPLSEDERKFHPEWSANDCIAELIRVAKINTRKVISRNHFRNYSDISESTWNRYFGTFLEFKRQADIILSRHAHRLERNIAKHASVDKMRDLNTDKRQWEGKFLRPKDDRFQTVLVGSDFHDICSDSFFVRLFLDTAKRARPEKIILNGDIFDLPEFSKFTQDPRSFNVVKRIQWVHSFLKKLRNNSPESEITMIEGNHEYRLLRHMGEQTQALLVVLNELHGYTVPTLLGLTDYEVNYIARADMTAFNEKNIKDQIKKNYITLFDNSLLFGHFPHMKNMGIPGANGHHHQHLVWNSYSPVFGPWEWHQTGCGHRRSADYTAGEKWGNGFLLVHCDRVTKRSQFEYYDCSHEHCMIGGKFYKRTDSEPVQDLIYS